MKKMRYLSLFLVFALLAGCTLPEKKETKKEETKKEEVKKKESVKYSDDEKTFYFSTEEVKLKDELEDKEDYASRMPGTPTEDMNILYISKDQETMIYGFTMTSPTEDLEEWVEPLKKQVSPYNGMAHDVEEHNGKDVVFYEMSNSASGVKVNEACAVFLDTEDSDTTNIVCVSSQDLSSSETKDVMDTLDFYEK